MKSRAHLKAQHICGGIGKICRGLQREARKKYGMSNYTNSLQEVRISKSSQLQNTDTQCSGSKYHFLWLGLLLVFPNQYIIRVGGTCILDVPVHW